MTNNLAQVYRRNILRLQASARGGQVIGLVGLIFSESEAEIEPIIADAPRTGLPCPAGQRLAAQGWGRRRYSPPWALVEQASVQSTVGVCQAGVGTVHRGRALFERSPGGAQPGCDWVLLPGRFRAAGPRGARDLRSPELARWKPGPEVFCDDGGTEHRFGGTEHRKAGGHKTTVHRRWLFKF